MLRTIAIWERRLAVVIPLITLLIGQIVICIFDVATLSTFWAPDVRGCVMSHSLAVSTPLLYVYTIVFNAIVLVFTTAGLITHLKTRSKIVTMLFTDGLVYFIVATLSSLVPTIFVFLNLNEIYNYMFVVPATTASTIVATRAVVRLIEQSPTLVVECVSPQPPATPYSMEARSVIDSPPQSRRNSRNSRNPSILPIAITTATVSSYPHSPSGSGTDIDTKEYAL